jgi:Na+-transporting methylmalonyl-CoA/oxaloacetate decarboxylase gamma subunit
MFAGIGTVFVALISIIAIIQVFHLIFGKRPESKKQKPIQEPKPQSGIPQAGPAQAVSPKQAEQSASAQAKSGNELIAVIAAAISAASGLSASAFRIASIQPEGAGDLGFKTPVWGRIERFNRQ